jgi:hypothetical protein
MPQHFMTPRELNKSAHLRASGNLSYREFIAVVRAMWHEVHPGIPILPSGGDQHAVYPAIIYSLQLRKPHPSEPKPRLREDIYTSVDEEAIIIHGQRFQNIINFSVITERNPDLAEELIETFEDFMLEYTPVYKELGISEFVYARRLPDDEENRKGEGICKRTVSYLVTTEKVVQTSAKKLNDSLEKLKLIVVHVRVPVRDDSIVDEVPSEGVTGTVTVDLQDEFGSMP